jgi:phage terminase large subunit
VVHRRGGKTVSTINEVIKRALTNKRQYPPPRYAYVAPYFNQAKRIAWGYAKHYSDPVPGRDFNESELKITLPNKAEIRLFGADSPDALRGDYLDGVACDEYQDWNPEVFPTVIRPMLADHKGWGVFKGTPKGHNGFYDLHRAAEADPENWFSMTLRASQSGLIPPEELTDIQRSMTADQYAQEFECSFDAAIQGSIYKDQIAVAEHEKRITDVPWRSELEVFTTWDLGFDDFTDIWFGQQVGREVHWIDHMELSGLALPEIAKRVKEKPYNYGDHYLPHDVEQHELISGVTRKATLETSGLRPIIVAPRQNVAERINATKIMFTRFLFDRKKCWPAIERLKMYRREYDAKRKVFKEKPLHDDNSHCADSLGTFCQAWQEKSEKRYRNKPAKRSQWAL